jgi:serine/threonine-protein kinase
MKDEDAAKTIEQRIAEDIALAETLVKRPLDTIQPAMRASTRGRGALDELRRLGGAMEGKLELDRTIGEGGMGVVRLATQATLGRRVAVKTLKSPPDGGASGAAPDATLRMLREAWVTGALEHPNIVPVYDLGVDAAGAPIIVMKRVEGRPWSELLHDPAELSRITGAADPLEANVRILLAVANAIGFAHSRGILHRDIKPENVMIGAFGEVYVVDWGIAVSLREDPSGRLPHVAHATELAGTPVYMAPEMLLGDPSALSPRTDVYLLGAVFYELFAGHAPHEGGSLQAMIASIVLSAPRFREGFPAEARSICEKAMHRDPAERFQTVEELRAAIDAYLQHRGSRKLARDAKQSLDELLRTLAEEPRGEERDLAVFNLLGECRFGYRAALSAWPGNVAARRGLDRALVAVIDSELSEDDPGTAAALLREVSDPPPDLAARVDAAVKRRAEQDDRLRKLGEDHDPAVSGRTRMFIGVLFGSVWTAAPFVLWAREARGQPLRHVELIGASVVFLGMGAGLLSWARDSLTRTLLNRRITAMVTLHFLAQTMILTGAWLAGFTPVQSMTLQIFSWTFTEALLAVWVERWFGAVAVVTAVSFFLASARPALLYPLSAVDNATLTLVVLLVWFPRQDIEVIRERRNELRRRARKLFLEMRRPSDAGE